MTTPSFLALETADIAKKVIDANAGHIGSAGSVVDAEATALLIPKVAPAVQGLLDRLHASVQPSQDPVDHATAVSASVLQALVPALVPNVLAAGILDELLAALPDFEQLVHQHFAAAKVVDLQAGAEFHDDGAAAVGQEG